MRELTAVELQMRLDRVRALHDPMPIDSSWPEIDSICSHCKDYEDGQYGWYVPWPCKTIRILDGAE